MTPETLLPFITRGPSNLLVFVLTIPPLLAFGALVIHCCVRKFRTSPRHVVKRRMFVLLILLALGGVGSMGLTFTPWVRHFTAVRVSNALDHLRDSQSNIVVDSISYDVRLTVNRLNEKVTTADLFGEDWQAIIAAARLGNLPGVEPVIIKFLTLPNTAAPH